MAIVRGVITWFVAGAIIAWIWLAALMIGLERL